MKNCKICKRKKLNRELYKCRDCNYKLCKKCLLQNKDPYILAKGDKFTINKEMCSFCQKKADLEVTMLKFVGCSYNLSQKMKKMISDLTKFICENYL